MACTPFFKAATATGSCNAGGTYTCTTSTSAGSASSVSNSFSPRAAAYVERPLAGSENAPCGLTPGTPACRSASWWNVAAKPAPTKPTRISLLLAPADPAWNQRVRLMMVRTVNPMMIGEMGYFIPRMK